LLEDRDVGVIHRTLETIETTFGWPPDIEWTGRRDDFTLLQARPVTTRAQNDQREWYLSLRPGKSKLEALCKRVTEDLIPELEAEGRRLAEESIEDVTDEALADIIDTRAATYARWKKTYWDDIGMSSYPSLMGFGSWERTTTTRSNPTIHMNSLASFDISR
jgi:pyruvate,water dikinase